MSYVNRFLLLLSVVMAIVFLDSCKKDVAINPFDDPSIQAPVVNTDSVNLEPNSFAYLHKNIFKPTCSNSGCHDGTFEPDFRTIYSSYNTLVYHPLISNNAAGTFTYRVMPGNADLSVLHERLINFIPNSSGIMPLAVDQGSDWEEKETEYIQNIKDWINDGAKDIYGNIPSLGNLHPKGIGIVAFQSGTTSNPYVRLGGSNAPIEVPASNIDVWFALDDDQTAASQMQFNKYKLNDSPYYFTEVGYGDLQIESAITEDDLWGSPTSFTHKASLDLSTFSVGTYLYLRVYVQDEDHPNPVEFPNDGSHQSMLAYFTLKVI
tara:strand:+ start:5746 stop:6705 length:960 start_codon:yes stop_codon:yes gene_type:complete